jgi:hemerythrin-like domain-containing protein
MLPTGPLMMEHRVIERLIAVMHREMVRISGALADNPGAAPINPGFIDAAVDFIRTYADKTHHGKEEAILFVECGRKDLAPEHRALLNELLGDHTFGRQTTGSLLQAKEDHLRGDQEAVTVILQNMARLTEFYPRHIHKEDHHFFPLCMDYFSQAEKDEILRRMWEYDQKMIHEKYRLVVEGLEEGGKG